MSNKFYNECTRLKMYTILVILAGLAGMSALYLPSSPVIELTPKNFDELVLENDEIWIVKFFTPSCSHSQKLVPEYTKLAIGLKGMIKVGAVNVGEHKDLGDRFGVKGFPTIKIFGANKNKPREYKGSLTLQGLFDAVLAAAKAKVKANLDAAAKGDNDDKDKTDVIQLNDIIFDKFVLESEDMWLVEFYAPWCGHCKNLAPAWAKAATELKGKVKLGAIDATINQAQATKYGVEGYPTIKFFPAGKKTSDSASDYDGGRTSSDIVTWALDQLAENVPPPEVSQIVGKKNFKEACDEKSLCILAVLPHILDCQSQCRHKYIEILKNLGEKYKKKMWGWVWSEAGAQIELEKTFDIGAGSGYPAMAAIDAKKMKYSALRGAFSKEGIDEFLKNISYGRIQTTNIKGQELPKIVKVQPWDGKDGQLPKEDLKLEKKEEL